MANRSSDRERSRSPDVGRATGEAGANSSSTRSTLPRHINPSIVASKQICCRDPTCNNDTFRVTIHDPNRPHEAELECVLCETRTSIDPTLRVLYQAMNGARSAADSARNLNSYEKCQKKDGC